MPGKPYLTPNEAASLLMVAPATLRVWTDKGLLHAQTTAGGHRRFTRDELERFRAARGFGQRILIVDDEAPLTRYLAALLGSYDNVTTAVAQDGYNAGRLVQTFRPQTLLLDLMMPGLDGFQVCEQIKSDPATQATRVIAMTGYPTAENVERILAAGAEACLDKPIDEERLLTLLKLTEKATA